MGIESFMRVLVWEGGRECPVFWPHPLDALFMMRFSNCYIDFLIVYVLPESHACK